MLVSSALLLCTVQDCAQHSFRTFVRHAGGGILLQCMPAALPRDCQFQSAQNERQHASALAVSNHHLLLFEQPVRMSWRVMILIVVFCSVHVMLFASLSPADPLHSRRMCFQCPSSIVPRDCRFNWIHSVEHVPDDVPPMFQDFSGSALRRAASRQTLALREVSTSILEEPDTASGQHLAPDDPQVGAFEKWISQKGCRGSAGLVHADFDGLRGLMATKGTLAWEQVASVPPSLLLEEPALATLSSTANPSPLSLSAWQRCPWWVRLGVRLLKEKSAGNGSRICEYVGILLGQGAIGTPMHWSDDQLNRLHYPHMLAQVSIQKRLFRGFQGFLLRDAAIADSKASEQGGVSAFLEALADNEMFDWAMECVLSRAFQLPPENASAPDVDGEDDMPSRSPTVQPPDAEHTRMALVPWIDSMNHYGRMPTHMYWETDGAVALAVGVPLDAGDHAFLSYGPVSNDNLLQYYGFVERDNPSDAYVLRDMGRWLKEDGLLTIDLSSKLLDCRQARHIWRYARRGVLLRDAVHPNTMQAVRIVCCERTAAEASAGGSDPLIPIWNGSEADLARFELPLSLEIEMAALELLMQYSAREADLWGAGGVGAAISADPGAPGLDGDLDGLGLDTDRRLMLSVFRQEKIKLLRGIVSRLTHMRKVSDMLNRPIKMPAMRHPPETLGGSAAHSVPSKQAS